MTIETIPTNSILHGDCTYLMKQLPDSSVDFILTDPPYLVNYRARDGRTVANDDNADWLRPAFAEMHRLLKPGSFCLSFYGWSKAGLFLDAWQRAGFRIVGHVVFRKRYASSAGFLQYRHEQAYLLAKGNVRRPGKPIPDIMDFPYTGNRLHPTQKPVSLMKWCMGFFPDAQTILDPFMGSGTTLDAARRLKRRAIGLEREREYCEIAWGRLSQGVLL